MIKQNTYKIGFVLVLSAILGNFTPTFAQETKNLLDNGSFEEGEIGPIWDKQWIPGWPTGGSPDVISVEEEPRTDSPGKRSIKIITTDQIAGGGISSAKTPMDPTKPLKVTGWIKEENTGAGPLPYIAVCWYDKSEEPIIVKPDTNINYVYITPYPRSTDWQKIEMNVEINSEGAKDPSSLIPKNAAYFQVKLFVAHYIGTIWFDDFTATQD